MYKKIIFTLSFALVLVLSSCGPAAEDRATMMGNAKRISDSVANLIQTAMKEAEMQQQVNFMKIDTAAARTNTAANTTTVAAPK